MIGAHHLDIQEPANTSSWKERNIEKVAELIVSRGPGVQVKEGYICQKSGVYYMIYEGHIYTITKFHHSLECNCCENYD